MCQVEVFERLRCREVGQDVVVVSHGGVMLALCAHVSGSYDELAVTPNAGIVVVEHCGANCRLVPGEEGVRA